MNIAGVIWDAVNIYDGVAVEIYISGCYHDCDGCHNSEMQDFNYGQKLSDIDLINNLTINKDWFDIISFLGGDLLCQDQRDAYYLSTILKYGFPTKRLWLFTGKDYGEIEENFKWCFDIFDVIKTGRYMKNLESNGKLASCNQKLLYKGKDY